MEVGLPISYERMHTRNSYLSYLPSLDLYYLKMVRFSPLVTLAIASLVSGAPTATSSAEPSPHNVSGLDIASTAAAASPTDHLPIEMSGLDPDVSGSLATTPPMSNDPRSSSGPGAIEAAVDWPMFPEKVGAGTLMSNGPATNPADNTQNFGFYGNVKAGLPAYVSWRRVSGDNFGFYITHEVPFKHVAGYLYHAESDMCVTLIPLRDTPPRFNGTEMTLAPCDTERDHPPPSQTFMVQYSNFLGNHAVDCIVAYNEGAPAGLERFVDSSETIHVARLGRGEYDNCILLIDGW